MTIKSKRIFAAIIDYIVILFLAIISVSIITLGKADNSVLSFSVFMGVTVLLALFKDVPYKNASVGKKLMKIKIVKSGQDSTLRLGDLVKRNLTLFFYPIEIILIIFDGNRWGDRIMKTNVVSADNHNE